MQFAGNNIVQILCRKQLHKDCQCGNNPQLTTATNSLSQCQIWSLKSMPTGRSTHQPRPAPADQCNQKLWQALAERLRQKYNCKLQRRAKNPQAQQQTDVNKRWHFIFYRLVFCV